MAYNTGGQYSAPVHYYSGAGQQWQRDPAPRKPNQYDQRGEQWHEYNDGYQQDQYYDDQNGYAQDFDDGGYYQGHTERQPQVNSYSYPQERQYDPRYQQRPPQKHPRGAPRGQPPYVQQNMRPHPSSQGSYPPQRPIDQQPNGQHTRQSQEIQSASLISPPTFQQSNAPPAQSTSPPQTQPPPQSKASQAKMSMAEWKEREKARMHADMKKQKVVTQDNAFPVFPGMGKNDSRPTSRSGAHSAAGKRASEEDTRPGPGQGRPSTSASKETSDRRRPGTGDRSHHAVHTTTHAETQSALPRPTLEHKPRSHDQGMAQRSHYPPYSQRERHSAEEQRSYVPNQASFGKVQNPARNQDRPFLQQADSRERWQHDMRSHARPTEPNFRQAQRQPAHTNGNVQDTANMPPVQAYAVDANERKQSQSSIQHRTAGTNGYNTELRSVDSAPKPQQVERESLRDLYDDYGNESLSVKPMQREMTGPLSREEEIEAEMPDFDSAAPNQTSSLHKRKQTLDKHLQESTMNVGEMPPMPAMPQHYANQSVRSLPATKSPSYTQSHGAGQIQNGAHMSHDGFSFGFEEHDTAQRQSQEYQNLLYDEQTERFSGDQYQQNYTLPYRPQNLDANVPNAPNQPRKSADNVPLSNGMRPRHAFPQGQRSYNNAPPGRSPIPAHVHRPDVERNYSGQTVYSDPGIPVVSNIPPPVRPGLPVSGPGSGQQLMTPNTLTQTGAPLTQQRSAPDRSSNPDSLPHHPVPVRAGLIDWNTQKPARPAPVRQYNGATQPEQVTRTASISRPREVPVTATELDQLRQYVASNPQNPKQALVLVKKLVEASSVLASENGRLDPKATAKNRERYVLDAHKRLKKLVAVSYPDAMFYLADCYGQGNLGLEVDPKEAFNLYVAAAKQGHAQAAFRTAMCCELGPEEGGGTRRDPQKAVQWYKRAAVLGDAGGMYKAGIISLKGLMGQPRNINEGVTWLKRAVESADNDNPHALHELALVHDPSSLVENEVRNKVLPDADYARELFMKAAQLGGKQSQFRLGQAYEYGNLGLPIDNRASISWYSKAAAQGEHQAELALSGWYLTGAEGILPNSDTEAYLWARKAASSEPPLAKAMFAMGYFSEMGIGCPKSIEEARRWYGRAAAHKFPKAIERIEELKKAGTKAGSRAQPTNGKLTRKDQKKDEAECILM